MGRSPVTDDDGLRMKDENGKVITESVDTDIMAKVKDGNDVRMLACEYKFTKRRTGMREYNELVNRTRSALSIEDVCTCTMFSRAGFTEELEDIPLDKLALVSVTDMGRALDALDRPPATL